MHHLTFQRLLALGLYFVALSLTYFLGSWHINAAQERAEKVISARATHIAEQLSAILSIPGYELDYTIAKNVAFSAMKNKELYAIKISNLEGLLEGQRRGKSGRLEPWDGEIIEKTVQAICPIIYDGERAGVLEVYLRVDQVANFVSLVDEQESARFLYTLLFCTLCLGLYFWQLGDLKQLFNRAKNYLSKLEERKLPNRHTQDNLDYIVDQASNNQIIDFQLAKTYLAQNTKAIGVSKGLFYYVFKDTPQILAMLASKQDKPSLSHIACLLLDSAPCIGAHKLAESAKTLKEAIQHDNYQTETFSCIQDLNDVLRLLKSQTD